MTSFLIIDDDMTFCRVLKNTLAKKGFEVKSASSITDAKETAAFFQPEYVLLDLNLHGESGLTLIPFLKQIDPFTKIVVLTGYATIPTAIESIKLGAIHYLAKPADIEAIISAFNKQEGDMNVPIETMTANLYRLEYTHIQSVLEKNQGNISATARELGLHRRTLQRKLEKNLPSALQ